MDDAKYLVGICLGMCPDREIKWRERNGLLHQFEVDESTHNKIRADRSKIVKMYSRSAAGKEVSSPENLRPSKVLLKTMNYLVKEIVPITKVPWITVYDFVNDRIQAIRQDMTIQMIEDENAVTIFEKCVRFYITASYLLCEESQTKFDQYLNFQLLSICIEKLFDLYKKFESEHIEEFISIYYSQNVLLTEVYFRSVAVFYNYLSDSTIKLSIILCNAIINNNFVKFFKLVQKLPLILILCFSQFFAKVRNEALRTLSVAFSSVGCKFPIDVLSFWLCVKEKKLMLELCEKNNINTDGKIVCFDKKSFQMSSPIFKQEEIINAKLKMVSLSDLINGFP